MKAGAVLGVVLGIGVIVQIFMGELGFAEGPLRDVHASIGIAGMAVVLAYVFNSRVNRVILAASSTVAVLTIMQVLLGLSIYGLLPLGIGREALEISHRANAYILFAAGLALSIISPIYRRRKRV